jgi:hypothetical protein
MLAKVADAWVQLSANVIITICFSTAVVLGLVMAAIYARRGLAAYEGRGNPRPANAQGQPLSGS